MRKTPCKLLVICIVLGCALLCGGCSRQSAPQEAAAPPVVEINSQRKTAPPVVETPYRTFDDTRKNVGVYLDTPDDILALKGRLDIIAWFEMWYGKSSKNAQKIELCGAEDIGIPFITWQPMNIPLEEIVNGSHDKYIEGYFERLAMYCPDNDILIRFAHEMEFRPEYGETWYTWQLKDDPQTYVAAWRHVVELGRRLNPNVKWVWSPNRADEYTVPYYPGDDYVDYVGLTLNLPEDAPKRYATFEEFYTQEGTKAQLEAYGKKILFSETAYSSGNVDEKAAYLHSVIQYVKGDPMVVGAVFFNENVSGTKRYRVSDSDVYMQVIYDGAEELKEGT